MKTEDADYAERLLRLESAWWKRLLDVQRPYRYHLRRLRLGFVLDIGCGIGRNLMHLRGAGVGVDHNPHAVSRARERGLTAMTPEEFRGSSYAVADRFDALLLSHVAEHMQEAQVVDLLREYLPFVRPLGKVVLITPQERGYASDPTHVEFMDGPKLSAILSAAQVQPLRHYSFPFPRIAGKLFRYNEFVAVGRKPESQ